MFICSSTFTPLLSTHVSAVLKHPSLQIIFCIWKVGHVLCFRVPPEIRDRLSWPLLWFKTTNKFLYFRTDHQSGTPIEPKHFINNLFSEKTLSSLKPFWLYLVRWIWSTQRIKRFWIEFVCIEFNDTTHWQLLSPTSA